LPCPIIQSPLISPQKGDIKLGVKKGLLDEFYKWFVGFSDAEANFGIFPLVDKTKIAGFSFRFTIGLHKDDLDALNYIKSKLDVGKVYFYKDSQIFVVTKKEDIILLISIFDKYTLNTTKYLDYLDFKKAFNLYHNKKYLTRELIAELLELKNSINTKRTSFSMPESHVVITKSWLLGFIEGDGSFSLEKSNLVPTFSINLTKNQLAVLVKIKEYLEKNLGFDLYSMQKLKCSSIITIVNSDKAINNSKPLATFMIKNIHILNNYLVSFLSKDGLEFITKKGKDFLDFKIICKAVYIGAHHRKEIKSLILKLSRTMNNYRLSTYRRSVEYLSKDERDLLINAMPTIEHLNDGRQRYIETKKVVHNRSSSCVYEIIKPTGEVLIKPNLAEAAKIINVGFNTLKRRLNIEGQVEGHSIRRIAVFYGTSLFIQKK
jgi:hypothetical protein